MAFDLYGESTPKTDNENKADDQQLVEIDLSLGQSLLSLIKPIKDYLVDRPDDLELNLYIVCGNQCSNDAKLFLHYLSGIPNPVNIIFRGIIHFDFLELFLKYKDIRVDSECKLAFDCKKLHVALSTLIKYQSNSRLFLQRYIDSYSLIHESTLLDQIEFKTWLN